MSIDEVILVGTSSQFNKLSPGQRTQIVSRKNNDIGSATLSIAFANESSASLHDDFYNFLVSNEINFLNDPGLHTLSTAIVLTSSGNETLTSITNDKLVSFDRDNLSNNKLYIVGGSLSLGNNFGTKPSVTVSTPTVLSDLGGTISVTISAAQFASILSANTSRSAINITNPSNLTVSEDESDPTPYPFAEISVSDIAAAYDGTNRLGNTALVGATFGGPSTRDSLLYWVTVDTISFSILQALRLPLMGVVAWQHIVILSDTAENLSVGLKNFTNGQMTSFNQIEISDNSTLVLDPETFAKIDKAASMNQTLSWSNHYGVSVVNSDASTVSIKLIGTLTEYTNAGLWDGTNWATTLTSTTDAANLVTLVNNAELKGTINSPNDIDDNLNAIRAAAGETFTTDFNFGKGISSNLDAASFIKLTELDSLTSQNVISDNFPSGLTINDTGENIKSMLFSATSEEELYFKNIYGLNSVDGPIIIEMSWSEFASLVTSSSSFVDTDTSTWATSLANIALTELNNVSIVIYVIAAELQTIIDKYSSELDYLPDGMSLRITDGGDLTLNASQFNILNRIISPTESITFRDTSANIGLLLDNAIPLNIIRISPTDTLDINVDQYRNLPDYYSGDVLISDSKDNIVAALESNIFDDRVKKLNFLEYISDHRFSSEIVKKILTRYTLEENTLVVNRIYIAPESLPQLLDSVGWFNGSFNGNITVWVGARAGAQYQKIILNENIVEIFKKNIIDNSLVVQGITYHSDTGIFIGLDTNIFFQLNNSTDTIIAIKENTTAIEADTQEIQGDTDTIITNTTAIQGQLSALLASFTTINDKLDSMNTLVITPSKNIITEIKNNIPNESNLNTLYGFKREIVEYRVVLNKIINRIEQEQLTIDESSSTPAPDGYIYSNIETFINSTTEISRVQYNYVKDFIAEVTRIYSLIKNKIDEA
jgi:hypothetical protein